MENITHKFWMKPGGVLHSFEDSMTHHHIHEVLDHPEQFATSVPELTAIHQQGRKEGTEKHDISHPDFVWSEGIHKFLAKKGFIRGLNNSNKKKSSFDLQSSKGQPHPSEFVEHVRGLIPHIPKDDRPVSIHLDFNPFADNDNPQGKPVEEFDEDAKKFLRDRGIDEKHYKDTGSIHLTSWQDIHKFIGESGGKRRSIRDIDEPDSTTSTHVRNALGANPGNVPKPIWNNMRTFGDSYTPSILSFRSFLKEMNHK
jgi:hypothetical protein